MDTITLPEAAVRLGKSERTVRRMVERGEIDGKLLLEQGRYRWSVTLPEPDTGIVAAGADRVDMAAVLERLEAKLDLLLARLPEAPPPLGTEPAHSETP